MLWNPLRKHFAYFNQKLLVNGKAIKNNIRFHYLVSVSLPNSGSVISFRFSAGASTTTVLGAKLNVKFESR